MSVTGGLTTIAPQTRFTAFYPAWSGIPAKPYVVVSPNGPGDGGDFGPNTPGTTTAGIQEAINAVGSGRVEILNGTYSITSTITLPNQITIEGQQNYSTIIKTNNNIPIFSLPTGVFGVRISRLFIMGGGNTSSTTSAHGITASDPTDCTFENLVFFNCYNAIDIMVAWHTLINNVRVGDLSGISSHKSYNGIYTHMPPTGSGNDNTALIVSNSSFELCLNDGIHLEHMSGSKWVNVEVNACSNYGIAIIPPNGNQPCHFSHWANVLADSCGSDNWHIDGTNAYNSVVSDMHLANIWSGNAGANCFYVNKGANIVISNPLVETAVKHAFDFEGGCSRCDITGGYISSYGTGAANTYAGVYHNGSTKCNVIGTQFVATNPLGSIVEVGTANLNRFAYNDVGDGGTIKAIGSGTITSNNRGFNPQPASSITVGTSPFTYTNNDPYPELVVISGGTLSAVSLQRGTTTSASAAGDQIVYLAQGDSVVVTYSAAPTMEKFPL